MKIEDFGKQPPAGNSSAKKSKREVDVRKSTKLAAEPVEEELAPIYGISEEQMGALKRIRKLSPEAYDRMINWD